MAYWNREFQRLHSPILRYGFSVVSVAIALGVAFALQYLPVPRRGTAGSYCGHRPHHLVCRNWAFRAGRSIVLGLLRLLLYGAALLLRHFQQRSTLLFHFRRMGGNCRLVQRCPTPNRGQPSSSPRRPSGRGGTAQAPRGRNSQTQSGTRQTGCGTRSDQQGIGIFYLFRLPRPAGAASPHGWILGAAAKTGIVFARREESAVHTNDSRTRQKEWAT